jgi:hypothetical protein
MSSRPCRAAAICGQQQIMGADFDAPLAFLGRYAGLHLVVDAALPVEPASSTISALGRVGGAAVAVMAGRPAIVPPRSAPAVLAPAIRGSFWGEAGLQYPHVSCGQPVAAGRGQRRGAGLWCRI